MPLRTTMARLAALAFALACAATPAEAPSLLSQREVLQFGAEWRLLRAGEAKLTWQPATQGWNTTLSIQSAGLVSKLYKVEDLYNSHLTSALCVDQIFLVAKEGKRHRETKVTFDAERRKADYIERDMLKNSVVLQKSTEVPQCVADVVGGLYRLRVASIPLGQSTQVPMTDGKKVASVKVEAQEREEIRTPVGTFPAIRYEIGLFNDVLISRKGRLFVWVSDDARRLPVQIRLRMQFYVGTITLQLEKVERG